MGWRLQHLTSDLNNKDNQTSCDLDRARHHCMVLTVVVQRVRRIQRHSKRDRTALHAVGRQSRAISVLIAVALHALDPERMIRRRDAERVRLAAHQVQCWVRVAVDREACRAVVDNREVKRSCNRCQSS